MSFHDDKSTLPTIGECMAEWSKQILSKSSANTREYLLDKRTPKNRVAARILSHAAKACSHHGISVFDGRLKTGSTTSTAVGCDCSTALTRLLLQTSAHRRQHNTDINGNYSPPIDSILICLDSGLRICEETLQCYNCNAIIAMENSERGLSSPLLFISLVESPDN